LNVIVKEDREDRED